MNEPIEINTFMFDPILVGKLHLENECDAFCQVSFCQVSYPQVLF